MDAKNSAVDIGVFRVPNEHLSCAPFSLGFGTTEEVEPLGEHIFIGQSRAEEAFRKGFATPGHIFVVGLDSISTALLENIKKKAASSMSSLKVCDIVCVHNFENPEKPRFIELGKGQAIQLEKAMEKLLEELKDKIPERLEGDAFRDKSREIGEQTNRKVEDAWSHFTRETKEIVVRSESLGSIGFVTVSNQMGINLFPILREDQQERPLTADEYQNLKEPERKAVDETSGRITEKISLLMRNRQKLAQETEEKVAEIKREFIDALFREKTGNVLHDHGEAVLAFIDGLREYTIGHIGDFLPKANNGALPMAFQPHSDSFLPFKINVFVDNSKTEGVPVIDHRNADYERIFGEVKYAMRPGEVPLGGHTVVRSGLISEASHGVLVLLAEDVFGRPGIWDRLKAVLETKRLDIGRGAANFFGSRNTNPETLHVDVKLVLVGDRHIYDILNSPGIKEKFDEVFRTVAEFDPVVARSAEVITQLTGLIRLFCKREDLPQVTADGVSEFLKYLSRMAKDQNKFSLDARSLKDLLHEAAWLAREEAGEDGNKALITVDNVKRAIKSKLHRVSLIRDKVYEFIESGDIILKLYGSEVGQINGLVVYDLGYLAFGSPSRIIAKTFAGKTGIINIEREAGLSGKTHNKGVLILGGYIGSKYAQETPLSFSATLSFEQSHAGVDGDSASSAELYAILSSLSGLPLRQDIAVTGSVGQNGEIQPIGGVNQKIEGFFDIASAFGLTGSQGVMIPQQNVKNLVLREDVVEAVKEEKFHIFAVKTVEDGMEILTGKKMGEKIKRGEHKGQYKKGTVNWLVTKRLAELAKAAGSHT